MEKSSFVLALKGDGLVLKTRVVTAFFIALAVFMVIFLTTPWGFRLAMAILWLTGAWEFTRLAGLGKASRWVLFAGQTILIGFMMRYWSTIADHALTFLTAACLTWCLMFLRLVTFRPGMRAGINYRMISSFCALASLSFAWFALAWLRAQPDGELLILLLIFIIWAADTGAYFAGKSFGKHKLAPLISPGKTWEGLLGGCFLAVLIALLIAYWTFGWPASWALFAILTVATVAASAVGDLFISVHKRTMDQKDTGKLFPGHGGVLDRFDSLLAGAPFFALGTLILKLWNL